MNGTTIIFFLAIVVGTLLITFWAAKQTTSTSQYYTAGGQLTGFQNGLAIAGDYLSAASFLGVTGAIALYGFDGFFYSIGFLVSYLVVLLFVAEPIRNLGQFTVGDVIASRFPQRRMRTLSTMGTMVISILYMVAQLVAAGSLIALLIGVDYRWSVIVTGSLMTIYVVFGGMMATSWIQIVKTVLLVAGVFMICLMTLSRFYFHMGDLIQAVQIATPLKELFLQPGNRFTDPLDTLSLNLALVLGTAGLPHILIRFLTVKDTVTVRQSVISATWVMGIFYVMIIFLGFGTAIFVGWDSLLAVDESGNMAGPLLAFSLGGEFLMAFVSAISFATILAVVSGVVICASSSFAHDFYRYVLCLGRASEKAQMRVAKFAAITIGIISILASLGAKNLNVAVLVSLIFSIAASVHFPLIFLTIYWRKLTMQGALWGAITGFTSSTLLVILGPSMMHPVSGIIPMEPLFSLQNPGIISIPLSFLVTYFVSNFSTSTPNEQRFREVFVQAQTGYTEQRKLN